MKILLSPAKSLDFENAKNFGNPSEPIFIEESKYLANKLQKLSAKQIQKLMSVSPEIASLNVERYQNWQHPFGSAAKQAGFVFTGEAYRGLDITSLSESELNRANNSLRILSGLYGVLKPLDLMLPYRLEMGTSLKITPKTTNLYKYWGTKITDSINSELTNNELLVNVASNEYSKVIDFKKIKSPVVNCHFKEMKGNEYKVIMTFAKKARGAMTRYIVQNDIQDKDGLLGFNLENYSFSERLSTETDLVFVR